jgi:hypothetical protein
VSSGAPSNNATGTDGEAASATPVMASHAAVTVSRLFTIVFSRAITVSFRRATVEGEILPRPSGLLLSRRCGLRALCDLFLLRVGQLHLAGLDGHLHDLAGELVRAFLVILRDGRLVVRSDIYSLVG